MRTHRINAYSPGRARDISGGCNGTVIHTGSAVDASHLPNAWKQINKGMMPILKKLKDIDPWFLEPTAGQGQSREKLDDLCNVFLEALEYPKQSESVSTPAMFLRGQLTLAERRVEIDRRTFRPIGITHIGIERIKLIHTNDSMDVCGVPKKIVTKT
jgi:deoxyribonuclease-4